MCASFSYWSTAFPFVDGAIVKGVPKMNLNSQKENFRPDQTGRNPFILRLLRARSFQYRWPFAAAFSAGCPPQPATPSAS
jgi:hypothetical protein